MNVSETLAALEAEADRCEAELARLVSHAAIERLQRAYGYYVDKGLWSEAADLFAGDATWEYGQSGVYAGQERIRAALGLRGPEGLATGELNTHMILQPIITVAPDNRTAKARWRSDMQVLQDGKALWGEGTYENSYVNEDGVWKIASLHFYVTLWCDYDQGWVHGNVPMAPASTELPPDRPPTEVYESLPGVHLPPYHYPNPVTGSPPEPGPQPIPVDAGTPAGLAELAAELGSVATRIERLEDVRAIEKLQRAYGYYVDKAMWQDVSDLFHHGSKLEIGGRGIFLGKRRVLEYMGIGLGPSGPQQGQIINHQQFQGIVTVDADGARARGRWRAFVIGGSPWAAVNWGDVTYENHYVKKDGVWTIDVLRAPFTMYTLYKDGWHKVTTPNTRPESFPPPPDLPPSVIYLTYPNYYNEPFHYPNPVTGREAPPPNPAAGGLAPMADYIVDETG
ncbi:MAG: nuclear transport factor 2 family protein [Sphingomonas sp.]